MAKFLLQVTVEANSVEDAWKMGGNAFPEAEVVVLQFTSPSRMPQEPRIPISYKWEQEEHVITAHEQ